MKKISLILGALLLFWTAFGYAQEIVNGSFEMLNSKASPRNWTIDNRNGNYLVQMDSVTKYNGKYAIKVDGSALKDTGKAFVYNAFGLTSAQKIKTIEVSCRVKLTLPIDSAMALILTDLRGENTMRCYSKKSATSPGGWQKLTLQFTPNQHTPWYGFYYGAEISSKTAIWLDDVCIKVNGQRVDDPVSTRFEPGRQNVQWLNTNLSPIKTPDITGTDHDLKPMGKLCANARLVGIGEPTHGTSEAFRFKLRLMAYLVTQKGFNTIALEEVIPICDIMNTVINHNPMAIKDSLLSLPFYKLYNTPEITALLSWISNYNSVHQQKLKFIGIDMEDVRNKMARQLLMSNSKPYSKILNNQSLKISKCVDSLLTISNKDGQHVTTLKLADRVKYLLQAIRVIIKNDTTITYKEQAFKLQTYVNVCEQWLNTRFYQGYRDQYLADNIDFYVKNHPKDKILIWAHNFHIARITSNGLKTMGTYLNSKFGKNYVPIGFTTAKGTYTATADNTKKQWNTYAFETAYRGTYEYILAKATYPFYFLPLNNAAAKQGAAGWLSMPMKHLDIPYIYTGDDDYKYYGSLNTVFDGIVFCKTTTASASYLKRK